jgi:PAS domain-containing protein
VGICIILDWKFKDVNPRFAEMFGYSIEDLTLKMGPKDIVLQRIGPKLKKTFKRNSPVRLNPFAMSSDGYKEGGFGPLRGSWIKD